MSKELEDSRRMSEAYGRANEDLKWRLQQAEREVELATSERDAFRREFEQLGLNKLAESAKDGLPFSVSAVKAELE